ncbi:DUF4921 family protein [Candidatus Woesearchaeota archaeon]|nr:DUF4921 family protein [Candidatus Woesearchaeota archaeon]
MELRKDYVLDRWVIIGKERGKRPNEYRQPKPKESRGIDVFAAGNEHLTPKEIGRLGSPWRMRWFPNKFPFVEKKKVKELNKKFFRMDAAWGAHEVIAETRTKKQLWDLPAAHFKDLLTVYRDRIMQISKDRKIKYVQVFKNHGGEGGASLTHSHTQVVSSAFIPPEVMDKVAACRKLGKGCYGKVIEAERKGPRRCFETKNVVAFCPFASRFNFEVWVFPKRYVRGIDELTDAELREMAAVIRKVLLKLRSLNAPYNMFLHYAPKGKELHMHFEITPRLQKWAGYEFSTGIVINNISPEASAKYYRS